MGRKRKERREGEGAIGRWIERGKEGRGQERLEGKEKRKEKGRKERGRKTIIQ